MVLNLLWMLAGAYLVCTLFANGAAINENDIPCRPGLFKCGVRRAGPANKLTSSAW